MSYSLVIADASVLITLSRINRLELLNNLYTEIYITPIVRDEYGHSLPDWLTIKDPEQNKYKRVLKHKIDKGEASSIALALEFKNALLIIDEKKGRKVARLLNLESPIP